MKLHRHLAEAVVADLEQVFRLGQYADRVLEQNFKANRKWGARDRRFVAETVYECVRWWRRLSLSLNEKGSPERSRLWRIVGAYLIIKGLELPEWDEFAGLDARTIAQRFAQATDLADRESIPNWLCELGEQELGDRWPGVLHELNEQAPVFLRVNTLRISLGELARELQGEDIETETISSALRLTERKNVFVTNSFKQGHFEVQDLNSQQIAPFLGPQPGERVIDACAGAGGKTLHLAALMKNKGRIIALDVSDYKLGELKKRARRAQADIIEARKIESTKVVKRLKDSADRLLLDVPCSGLGALRRNPDSKWKLSMEELDRLRQEQAKILREYSVMLKPSGTLVYATCSILPSENEKQVQQFLNEHPSSWKLLEEKTLYPEAGFGDGFYMAKLHRLS